METPDITSESGLVLGENLELTGLDQNSQPCPGTHTHTRRHTHPLSTLTQARPGWDVDSWIDPHRDTRGSSLIPKVIWTLTLYTRRWQPTRFLTAEGPLTVHRSESAHGEGVTRVARPQAKVRNRWRQSVPAVPGAVRDGISPILHLGKPRPRQAKRLPSPQPLVE